MNNNVKIALGIIAGGSLVLATQLLKSKKKNKIFTAPDGNSYKENQMYRTAHGEIFQNGKQLHFETPELLAEANQSLDSNYGNDKSSRNNQSIPRNINYHQKGVRHH
ncbi:hypothetical protein ACFOWU_17840 [Epilithonimonas zeae]|uniref:Uncharacterized protein n=1 Tax=Epilithonimonas zeae TaxID=1416779 RepID=A0A1N6JMM6_9FLAO|nr:hypothetical protein [Epilithonimonas zeae]SIO45427.1 hypothetical protein SAMN05444409_3573 [Epilithonimonas zeae]